MTGREFSCYPDVFVTLLNGVSCQTSDVYSFDDLVSKMYINILMQ